MSYTILGFDIARAFTPNIPLPRKCYTRSTPGTYPIIIILLSDEDRKLLRKMESEVSKETLGANFDELMQYPPLHSGSPEE